jgi:hypothetical protein
LVIGGQGVIGSFVARALREAGWEVTRGGRRAEEAGDFRLVDLEREDTVEAACADAHLVVTSVQHRDLPAERAVLRNGGVLLHLLELSESDRERLAREIPQPRGLVVDRSGLGGVTGLAMRELLEAHSHADTAEFGFLLSAREKAGPDGGLFVRRLLRGPGRHATATVELPEPFGRRRCIEAGPEATQDLLGEMAGARTARLYLCFVPRAFAAFYGTLNALGRVSRVPEWLYTAGRGKVPRKLSDQPTCHWTRALLGGQVLASRFVLANGDYGSTVEATVVFADALVPRAGEAPSRTGILGLEQALALPDLEPALAERGITVERRGAPTNATAS